MPKTELTRRQDGRAVKTKYIDGKKVFFYSSEKSDRAAIRDIENQMINYVRKKDYEKHNFKCLAEKMLEFKKNSISYNTYIGYEFAIKRLSVFNEFNIDDITPAMVQNHIDTAVKQKKYSFSAVAKDKIVFGLVLDYAIVHENLKLTNFMRSIKIPKGAKKGKIKAPDDEVTHTIVENAETVEFGMWAMCFLCLGLRRGELAALQKRDIDFKTNLIYVNRSVEFIHNQPHLKDIPKTEDSIGSVPILDIIKPMLIKMCKNLKKDDFLFGGEKPLTETQIKKRWKKYCDTIGYSFNGHQLRHAYAKLLYKAGVDPKTMQRLLRHADFSTTMNIYTEFANEVTEKSVVLVNQYMLNQLKNKVEQNPE